MFNQSSLNLLTDCYYNMDLYCISSLFWKTKLRTMWGKNWSSVMSQNTNREKEWILLQTGKIWNNNYARIPQTALFSSRQNQAVSYWFVFPLLYLLSHVYRSVGTISNELKDQSQEMINYWCLIVLNILNSRILHFVNCRCFSHQ